MGSRLKAEEKNEKAIRSFLKKNANRRCINCNSLGPQYVCLNFCTFVCTQCSGIHREFTHRVKSVSMSKFSEQEVAKLENGGNERGREIYFKDWDSQRQPLPDSSNVDRLRDFIKSVYVDRRYCGENQMPRSRRGDQDNIYESQCSEFRSNNQQDSRGRSYKDRYENQHFGTHGSKTGYEDYRYEGQKGCFNERRNSKQFEGGRDRPDRSQSDNGRYEERMQHENRGRQHVDCFNEGDRRVAEHFANDRQLPLGNQGHVGSSHPAAHPMKEILGEDVPRLRVEGRGSQTVNGHEMNRSHSLPDAQGQRFGSSSSFGSANGHAPVVSRENSGRLIDFLEAPAAPVAKEQSDMFGSTPDKQTLTNASSSTGWATFDIFSSAGAGPGGAVSTAASSLSVHEDINGLAKSSNGSASWLSEWPSLQTASAPSPLQSRAESWLSLVEPMSKPPMSPADSGQQSSFAISSTPVSVGQVQIVQDLPRADFSAAVPTAVFTTRQEHPEGFFIGMQTGQLTRNPLPVPQHMSVEGKDMSVGSYNQPQKSRNPFDLVGDSLTTSTAEEFPNMRPLQASFPSLDTSPPSIPGAGVSSFGPEWTQTKTLVPEPISFPLAASGGLFAAQHEPSMTPQIMRAGSVGPYMGAWTGNSLSTSNQGGDPYFQGQRFTSQSSLGSFGIIPGMSGLVPVQASPQFPTYNSLGPVSNPFG